MCKTVATIMGVMMSVIAFAAPTVTDVVAKQRYPWGLVDITCKVSGIEEDATKRFGFIVSAVIPNMGITNWLSHVWIIKEGDKTRDLSVSANGEYRLLWDAKADLGEVRYTNMVVRIIVDKANVQLWEGGPYWATTNIGAEEPEDYGYYFWWGDTIGYKRENDKWVASDGSNSNFSFAESNAPTYNKDISTLQSKGWITADGVLAPEHDAAKVQWGGDWRMPTKQDIADLTNKCDWTWTTMNGVKGYVVCGRGEYASNSIFLPCAGIGGWTSFYDSSRYGGYRSAVPLSDSKVVSWSLEFSSSYHETSTDRWGRFCGQSVRPVQGFTK